MSLLQDSLHRPLRDLRISVTDRCNFRCRYCMPEEIFGANYAFLPNERILSFEEIERLVRIFVSLGVKKIRLTGGEPLLRKNLPDLVRQIAAIEGVEEIALTTNGSLLKKLAQPLADAGLKRVSVSLDSLNEQRFGDMNGHRGSVNTVLEGIEHAANAGLFVKINMVVQNGKNDADIEQMAQFFKEKPYILRFIEYMDVGNSNGWQLNDVVSKQEILERLEKLTPLQPIKPRYVGEVASRYQYADGQGEIGIISSVTDSFCSTCSRARISAEGTLYTCLFALEGTDLRTLLRSTSSDEQIAAKIKDVWMHRTDRYSDERLEKTSTNRRKIEMSHIGG